MTYSDYSKETAKQMRAVERYLKDKYGKIESQWEISLRILADQLEILRLCRININQTGLLMSNGDRNNLITVMKESSTTILKIVQQFGLSVWSQSKIKNDDTSNKDAELLKNIMG